MLHLYIHSDCTPIAVHYTVQHRVLRIAPPGFGCPPRFLIPSNESAYCMVVSSAFAAR